MKKPKRLLHIPKDGKDHVILERFDTEPAAKQWLKEHKFSQNLSVFCLPYSETPWLVVQPFHFYQEDNPKPFKRPEYFDK